MWRLTRSATRRAPGTCRSPTPRPGAPPQGRVAREQLGAVAPHLSGSRLATRSRRSTPAPMHVGIQAADERDVDASRCAGRRIDPVPPEPVEHALIEGNRQVLAVHPHRAEPLRIVRKRGEDQIEAAKRSPSATGGDLPDNERALGSNRSSGRAREEREILRVDDIGVVRLDLGDRGSWRKGLARIRSGIRGSRAASRLSRPGRPCSAAQRSCRGMQFATMSIASWPSSLRWCE